MSAVDDVLQVLSREHPEAFSFTERTPLKVGIFSDIREAHPELPKKDLAAALRRWTTSSGYCENLAKKVPRVDLSGKPGEAPTDVEAASAFCRRGRQKKAPIGELLPNARQNPDYLRAIAIRDGAEPGTELVGENLEFIMGLLKRHPDADAKMRGTVGIRIASHADTNVLALVGSDGSVERFSLLKCFRLDPRAPVVSGQNVRGASPVACTVTVRSFKASVSIRTEDLPPADLSSSEYAMTLQAGDVQVRVTLPGKNYRKVAAAALGKKGGYAAVQGNLDEHGVIAGASILLRPDTPKSV